MSRILIVDDDAFNRELIEETLQLAGYQVATAPHGQAALELIPSFPPDLILLDIYMSVMDGPEFARAYRQLPDGRAPIIVVTAREDAASQAAQLGADGYLGKPFELSELLDLLSQYVKPDQPSKRVTG